MQNDNTSGNTNWNDLWERVKHTPQSFFRNWLHATKLISFARIKEVYDVQTVLVEEVVQTSASLSLYIVTLLSPSSSLFEHTVEPQVGDAVLLLFLQNYDGAMFDLHSEPLYKPEATGYNHWSGVGIHLCPLKGMSATTVWHEAGEVAINSLQPFFIQLRDALNLTFSGCGDMVEKTIALLFDGSRPFTEEHWARVLRKYGTDGSDAPLDASVREEYSEKAPLTIDSKAPITIKSKDYSLEIDGPVTIESSEAITITSNEAITIKSSDNIFIGNNNNNLGAFLKDLLEQVASITVSGATVNAGWAAQLRLMANDVDAFLDG